MLYEARLAHSRLAADRRDSAGASRGVPEEPVQVRQDRFALEEVHVASRGELLVREHVASVPPIVPTSGTSLSMASRDRATR